MHKAAELSFPARALRDSIRTLPGLTLADDPGAATQFDSNKVSPLAQAAWNYGAVVPVGAAAAALWYLNKAKKRKPLRVVQPEAAAPAPMRKAAAPDITSVLETIRHHLPKLRPVDTAVGMAGGAGAGLLWDLIRGTGKDEQGRKKPSRRLQRVLSGALLGAGASNIAGDRFRRYLSNTVYPTNYGRGDSKIRELIPGTRFDPLSGEEQTGKGGDKIQSRDALQDIWQGAVLDKPTYKVAPRYSTPSVSDHALSARRELVRRSFGLPINNKDNAYWQKNKGGYYSLNEQSPEYATRLRALFGPSKPLFQDKPAKNRPYLSHEQLLRAPHKTLRDLNTARDYVQETQNVDFSMFGGPQINGVQQLPHKTLPDGTIAGESFDRWDMTLGDKEQRVFDDGMKALRTGGLAGFNTWGQQPMAQQINKYMGPGTSNNINAVKTLAGRWAWDKILTDENPWVRQRFQLTKAPQRSWSDWMATSNEANRDAMLSPYRLQFLTDSGAPATQEMSQQALRKWMANPAGPVNRIPKVTDGLLKSDTP